MVDASKAVFMLLFLFSCNQLVSACFGARCRAPAGCVHADKTEVGGGFRFLGGFVRACVRLRVRQDDRFFFFSCFVFCQRARNECLPVSGRATDVVSVLVKLFARGCGLELSFGRGLSVCGCEFVMPVHVMCVCVWLCGMRAGAARARFFCVVCVLGMLWEGEDPVGRCGCGGRGLEGVRV